MGEVHIVDTTLRDGEQAVGIAFSKEEKIYIAKALCHLGIHYIEAGIPAMGGEEKETIKDLVKLELPADIIAWNRAKKEDLQASLECGVSYVHISVPASDLHIEQKLNKNRQWILEKLAECIVYAKEKGCRVSVGAEDASRADQDFLIQLALLARKEGAERLRYADTVGVLDPFKIYDHVQNLLEKTNLDIEIHAHNDFGMATANALAAVQAGAKYISATINGLGERAGNSSLEEVDHALKHIFNQNLGIKNDCLTKLCEYVARATNRELPVKKIGRPLGDQKLLNNYKDYGYSGKTYRSP